MLIMAVPNLHLISNQKSMTATPLSQMDRSPSRARIAIAYLSARGLTAGSLFFYPHTNFQTIITAKYTLLNKASQTYRDIKNDSTPSHDHHSHVQTHNESSQNHDKTTK